MCGRFKLSAPFTELVRLYGLTNSVNLRARYNIAPTDPVAVVRSHDGARTLDTLRWGLVPFWSKERTSGPPLINAKADTVAKRPAYREAFIARRCIVPADGFYEWQKLDRKTKQPYLIRMRDGAAFGFASLWEWWTDPTTHETLQSCTIITTQPNALCAPIHNRMPVILEPEHYGAWLGEQPTKPGALQAMLAPYPAAAMEAIKIGPRVGNVKNDDAAIIEPSA